MQGSLQSKSVSREESRTATLSLDSTIRLNRSLHFDMPYKCDIILGDWRDLLNRPEAAYFEYTTSTILDSEDPGRVSSIPVKRQGPLHSRKISREESRDQRTIQDPISRFQPEDSRCQIQTPNSSYAPASRIIFHRSFHLPRFINLHHTHHPP
jgi:hypothetical protein